MDGEVDERVLCRARNDLIFGSQGSAILVICAVILSLTYFLLPYVELQALVAWTVVCLCSYGLRYALCMRYSRAGIEMQSGGFWRRLFVMSCALSGAIWGLSVFVIYPESSPNHQMLQIILVVILCAATTVTHSAVRWAGASFTLCSLLPITGFLFFKHEEGFIELGLYILLFMLTMLSAGTFLARSVDKLFMLSHTNTRLVHDLTVKNQELSDNNDQLYAAKQALRQANDDLQKLATTDALTGLTNRRKFEALAKVKWQRAAEQREPVALLLINVDKFKQYNDFYGQRKADSCLVQIGEYLQHAPEVNRKGDCLARYNGDEFAVLLVNADLHYATKVAEKIRQGIELLRISRAEMPHELSPWVSVSIGVASEEVFEAGTYEDLFERADRALYLAKRQGRNQVQQGDSLSA